MMPVIVSIVAGVFAIGSAFPWANEHKVVLSIMFVGLVTVANLRGARESGTLFAIPTYGFVVSILILIGVGAVRCFGGCPAVVPPSEQIAAPAAIAGITIFALLKAFSQGATALTGVEARPGPVHAEPIRQPRRPAGLLQRRHRARRAVVADDLHLQGRPEHADPLLRGGRVHVVHAVAKRDGPALDRRRAQGRGRDE